MIRLSLMAIVPSAALALVILFAAPIDPARKHPRPIVPMSPPSGLAFLADLERRLERVQPMVEREIGMSLGKVELLVLARDEIVKNAMPAARERVRRIENGPRGEALEGEARAVANGASELTLAHVDDKGRVIFPDPGDAPTSLLGLMGMVLPKSKFSSDERALDLVLIHELIHVHQHLHLEGADFLGAVRSRADLRARGAVFEGHADFLTRRTALGNGMEDLWELYEGRYHPWPEATGFGREDSSIAGADYYFSYVQGRRFFEVWVDRLGYDAAVQRVFQDPPSLAAISRPEEYARAQTRSEFAPLFEDLRRWLARERGHADLETLPLQFVQKMTRGNADTFVEGYRLQVGYEIVFDIVVADDERGARALFGPWVDTRERLQDLWMDAGGGLFTEKRSRAADGWLLEQGPDVRVRRKVERRGRFLFDMHLIDDTEFEQGAERLIRRAFRFLTDRTWRMRWLVGSKRLLQSEDPDLRIAAVTRQRRFVPDEDWEVRWLGRWYEARDEGRPESERVAALAAALADDHPALICRGLRASSDLSLWNLPPRLVHRLLQHERSEIRRDAWRAGLTIRDEDEPDGLASATALRWIAEAMDDPDRSVRMAAAGQLNLFEGEEPGLAAVFRKGLGHADESVRYETLSVLSFEQGLGFPELMPQLVNLLAEEPEYAAEALANLDPSAAAVALPELRAAMAGSEGRAEIALAIWQIGEDTEPLFALVRKSVADGKPDGLGQLGELGIVAWPVVPAVITALQHERSGVRESAARTLGQIGDSAARDALSARLRIETDADVRERIERALTKLEESD